MFKIDRYKSLVHLILLDTVKTLSYTLWPIEAPNKVVGILIFLNVLWVYCDQLNVKKLIIAGMAISCVMIAIVQASSFYLNLTDSIYYLVGVFLLASLSCKRFTSGLYQALEQSENLVRLVVLVCNLLLCIGFFDSRCYDTSQWDGTYFLGYTNASHTLCSGICLLFVLTLFFLRRKTNILTFAFFVPGAVAILQSGARTYLVSLVILLIIFYIFHIKQVSLKVLLLPVAAVIAFYAFLNSSMMTKFLFSVNNEYSNMDYLGKLTNGRTEFWILDIRTYLESNFFHKIFGFGFDYVYNINLKNFGLSIWAHNDLINCLISVGAVGTITYLFSVFWANRQIWRGRNRSWFSAILLICYMILPAFLNGFYAYQHHLYSFIILSVLFVEFYTIGEKSGVEQ